MNEYFSAFYCFRYSLVKFLKKKKNNKYTDHINQTTTTSEKTIEKQGDGNGHYDLNQMC